MRSHRIVTSAEWRPALVAAVAVTALAGCGSSKPQYCSDRSSLEQSVNGLGNVKLLTSGGAQALKSQLATLQSDAKALAASAKSDFPSESSAVRSSVTKLQSDLQALPSSPTPQQLKPIIAGVSATVTAFDDFKTATSSACS